MAKNMTLVKAMEYMAARNRLSESSRKAMTRRYRLIADNVKYLYESDLISTTSPAAFTVADFVAFVKYRSSLKNSASDLNHHISAMNKLMLYCGNHNGDAAMELNPDLRPVTASNHLDPLPNEIYDAIWDAYEGIDKDDFSLVRAFTLIFMYMGTGCRNSELRLAKLGDLNTEKWTIKIRNPKGKTQGYGLMRSAPVPEEFRAPLIHYLELRKDWLRSRKILDAGYIFFGMDRNHGEMSDNAVRRVKDKIARMIGAQFEIRDLRRYCGQRYLENGVPLEIVAKILGHKTVKTTQEYYVLITDDMMISSVDGKWSGRKRTRKVDPKEDGMAKA